MSNKSNQLKQTLINNIRNEAQDQTTNLLSEVTRSVNKQATNISTLNDDINEIQKQVQQMINYIEEPLNNLESAHKERLNNIEKAGSQIISRINEKMKQLEHKEENKNAEEYHQNYKKQMNELQQKVSKLHENISRMEKYQKQQQKDVNKDSITQDPNPNNPIISNKLRELETRLSSMEEGHEDLIKKIKHNLDQNDNELNDMQIDVTYLLNSRERDVQIMSNTATNMETYNNNIKNYEDNINNIKNNIETLQQQISTIMSNNNNNTNYKHNNTNEYYNINNNKNPTTRDHTNNNNNTSNNNNTTTNTNTTRENDKFNNSNKNNINKQNRWEAAIRNIEKEGENFFNDNNTRMEIDDTNTHQQHRNHDQSLKRNTTNSYQSNYEPHYNYAVNNNNPQHTYNNYKVEEELFNKQPTKADIQMNRTNKDEPIIHSYKRVRITPISKNNEYIHEKSTSQKLPHNYYEKHRKHVTGGQNIPPHIPVTSTVTYKNDDSDNTNIYKIIRARYDTDIRGWKYDIQRISSQNQNTIIEINNIPEKSLTVINLPSEIQQESQSNFHTTSNTTTYNDQGIETTTYESSRYADTHHNESNDDDQQQTMEHEDEYTNQHYSSPTTTDYNNHHNYNNNNKPPWLQRHIVEGKIIKSQSDHHAADGKPLTQHEYVYHDNPFMIIRINTSSLLDSTKSSQWNIKCHNTHQIKTFFTTLSSYLQNYGIPLIPWKNITAETQPHQICDLSPTTIRNYNNIITNVKNSTFVYLSSNKEKLFKNFTLIHGIITNYEKSSDGLGVIFNIIKMKHPAIIDPINGVETYSLPLFNSSNDLFTFLSEIRTHNETEYVNKNYPPHYNRKILKYICEQLPNPPYKAAIDFIREGIKDTYKKCKPGKDPTFPDYLNVDKEALGMQLINCFTNEEQQEIFKYAQENNNEENSDGGYIVKRTSNNNNYTQQNNKYNNNRQTHNNSKNNNDKTPQHKQSTKYNNTLATSKAPIDSLCIQCSGHSTRPIITINGHDEPPPERIKSNNQRSQQNNYSQHQKNKYYNNRNNNKYRRYATQRNNARKEIKQFIDKERIESEQQIDEIKQAYLDVYRDDYEADATMEIFEDLDLIENEEHEENEIGENKTVKIKQEGYE